MASGELTVGQVRRVDISVVVVSYKSSDLLMLTLASVRRAVEGLEAEVFVVDNASADGTAERVRAEAPWVTVVEMGFNSGFAKANNVALSVCRGDVILLLNPDTVVCRDTFASLVGHFRAAPASGAVGVRMVNGQGRYLGESKRGYPSLPASFFKLSSLWRLAPRSKTLNAYYLGQHGETEVCHAPILSGAFFAFSRSLLDRVGGLDEGYFMYGEDVDYSWRMELASGGGNVCRGDMPIVHFKGQSTPRRRVYIESFFRAMHRFAARYELPRHGRLVRWLTNAGIWVAFWVAMTRCVVRRSVEGRRRFAPPSSVVFVSDSPADGVAARLEGGGVRVERVAYRDIHGAGAPGCDAVVFSVDGDIAAAVDFMRRNSGKTLFGFYNPDNGDALVYFNNRCHKI